MRYGNHWSVGFILLFFLLCLPGLATPSQEQEIKRNIKIFKSPSYSEEDRQAAFDLLLKIGRPSVPALIQVLKDKKPEVREDAVWALRQMGSVAVPDLIQALTDQKSEVQSAAASTLGQMGSVAKEAVPALRQTLQDPKPDVRSNAAWALGQIGWNAKEAVPDLAQALKKKNNNPAVRLEVIKALGSMGPAAADAVSALIQALKDQSPNIRINSAWALGQMGSVAKEAVPALVQALEDDNPAVIRREVASALGAIGPAALEAIPALIKVLGDGDPIVRSEGANALGRIGPMALEATPNLLKAFGDKDPFVRSGSAYALGSIGPTSQEVVLALNRVLKDGNPQVRSTAADALGKAGLAAVPILKQALKDEKSSEVKSAIALALGAIGPAASEAGLVLSQTLRDENPEVRSAAANALGRIGLPAAKEAIPVLSQALEDQKPEVRSAAAQALGKMGTAAVPALYKALENQKTDVRVNVSESLAQVVAEAKDKRRRREYWGPGAYIRGRFRGNVDLPLLHHLIQAMKYSDTPVRINATFTLGEVGSGAKEAVPALIQALKDQNLWVRINAARALGQVGWEAKEASPALILVLKNDRPEVRLRAASALGLIFSVSSASQRISPPPERGKGLSAKEAVSVLVQAMENRDYPEVRMSAALALGQIGPEAKDAVPALKQALLDTNFQMRSAAAQALGLIGPEARNAVPVLIQTLQDPKLEVRSNVVLTLGKIGSDPERTVPALIQALKDKEIKGDAVKALGLMGPAAIPDLIQALTDKDPSIRWGAASALGWIGQNRFVFVHQGQTVPKAVPALSQMLKDENPEAREAIPALSRVLKDENPEVRSAAAETLGNMGPAAQKAVPALGRALQDEKPEVKQKAAQALRNLGPAAKDAVPALIKALSDPGVKTVSLETLTKMGPAAQVAIPAIAAAFGDTADNRRQAAQAINEIAQTYLDTMNDLGGSAIKEKISELENLQETFLKDLNLPEDKHLKDNLNRVIFVLRNSYPWQQWLKRGWISAGLLSIAYLFLLPPLILLYTKSSLARTAVNSGLFTKFPLIHKSILNTQWARGLLFATGARKYLQELEIPHPYIAQTVYGARNPQSQPIHLGETDDFLSRLCTPRPHALLLGRSGTGKSVLLRYLLHRALEKFLNKTADELPLLIDLSTHPLAGRQLEEVIADELKGHGVELPDEMLRFWLKKGRFFILIDSLNEIDSKVIKNELQAFLNRDFNNRIVMASQLDLLERPDVQVFQLAEVSAEQARGYLLERLGSDIWERLPLEVQGLARNPQDLTLLGEVLQAAVPEDVPTKRAELYRSLLEMDTALAPWVKTDTPEIRAIYELAFCMVDEGRRLLREDELANFLSKSMEAHQVTQPERLAALLQGAERSRMFHREHERLLGLKQTVISFTHELVGKFLASRHLRTLLTNPGASGWEEVLNSTGEPRWLEVCFFAMDELPPGGKLLDKFLQDLILRGGALRLRLVAYALGTRAPDVTSQEVREAYNQAKMAEDLRETPASIAPAGLEFPITESIPFRG